ncbi:hypothetical protein, partial [Bradyrhizobium sp. NBAIM01]|uniref:hypothetical protein n=1 Tax=Bradyrhizobium sp. NBAIM01 TaxID=2793818 RepID=UPI001CD729D6
HHVSTAHRALPLGGWVGRRTRLRGCRRLLLSGMMTLMVRWRLSQSWLGQDGEQQRCSNGST